MDFGEIKKKYPKAWERFEDFAIESPELEADVFGYSDDYVDDINRLNLITLSGYLFGFFDKQNLVIMVTLSGRWYWRVCSLEIPTVWSNLKTPGLNSRKETEAAAFTKAFEILEA